MLDDFAKAFEMCAFCPKLCRHVCPVADVESRESVTPQSKMMMGHLIRSRRAACNSDYASVFYHCAGCGHCTEYCEHDVPVTQALFAARAEAARCEAAPDDLNRFVERFYARNEELVHRLHRLVEDHYFVEEAQVAYMPGCDLIEFTPEDVGRTLRVFEAAGVDYVALMENDLVCGGYPLWAAGYPAEFVHVAQAHAHVLKGYKKLVTACPSCAYAMRHLYPAMGVDLSAEVLHVTEFLDTVAHRIPISKTLPSAFFHDPCYLGRFLGVFEPPRRLAECAVRNLQEFTWNREQSVCCGAGGLMPTTVPDAVSSMAKKRLEEIYDTDTSLVVTACASCVHNLKSNAPSLEVIDVVALLERAL